MCVCVCVCVCVRVCVRERVCVVVNRPSEQLVAANYSSHSMLTHIHRWVGQGVCCLPTERAHQDLALNAMGQGQPIEDLREQVHQDSAVLGLHFTLKAIHGVQPLTLVVAWIHVSESPTINIRVTTINIRVTITNIRDNHQHLSQQSTLE